MSVPELVGGLPPPCRMAIPRVFFIVRHNADNQRTTTSLDFLNNKKDCKNLQNNIEDSERREQKQMKTEISDLVMPSRILSYLKILKVEGNAKSSLNLHLLVSAKRGFGLLCVIRCPAPWGLLLRNPRPWPWATGKQRHRPRRGRT